VAEGGVLLSEVDQDALSSWWSTCLHTELDAETLEDAWSCGQCVADARYGKNLKQICDVPRSLKLFIIEYKIENPG